MNHPTIELMRVESRDNDVVRAQGIPLFIIAAIVTGIALILWRNDFELLVVTAVLALALFLIACGVQSFMKPGRQGRAFRNPLDLFSADKLPFILGLIPLAYAVVIGLYLSPPKARMIIIFFGIFIALIISYLRDFFRPRKAEETDNIDKFYEKVAEAERALGVRRGIGGEDITTRRISFAERFRLLKGMLRFAPWQLIAALVLAVMFMISMDFFG